MGRSRFKFGESPFPHFLTCTVVGWLPVFTRPETVQILLDSWQFLQDQGRLTLPGYVVLENHVHFIASAENLAKEVGDFTSYTARRAIDDLSERHVRTLLDGLEYHKARHKGDREFPLWQEGSHPLGYRDRDDAAAEAGVHPPEPREAGLRERPGALAVF
jgi:putative transposase